MHTFISILEKSLLLIFLICGMLGVGLVISPRAMVAAFPPPRGVLSLLLLNFVFSPAIAYLLTVMVSLDRPYAIGLLLLGGAAGAPFLPKLAETAGADLALSVTLMALLTLVTTLFLPVAMPFLFPGLAPSPWKIIAPMVLYILAPLALGMFLKGRSPNWAARYQPMFSKIASAAAVLLILTLLVGHLHELVSLLGSGAMATAALFTLILLGAGYLSSGGPLKQRSVYCLAAGARNIGAALVAASSLSDPRIVLMLLVSTLVSVALLLPAAAWVRRRNQPLPT